MTKAVSIALMLLAGMSLAGVFLYLAPEPGSEEAQWTGQKQPPTVPETSMPAVPAKSPERRERVTVTARIIEPDLIVPPPVTGTFEQAEPRGPLGEIALAKPPRKATAEPETWKPQLLYRPLIVQMDRLEAAGYVLRMAGVSPPGPDVTCVGADGASLPCGMIARTAFRNWVRGRAITCRLPAKPVDEDIATRCTLGGKDVALWLAENGWLVSATSHDAGEALERAKTEGRGLYEFGPVSSGQ
ncbi:MAG: thermonuclease family protein [Notoacmeibacter sp.]|nr:thermonuclease family protein [Notoacmeibacter sp.]